MSILTRNLRALGAAVAILALSATVVFAAKPTSAGSSADHRQTQTQGQTGTQKDETTETDTQDSTDSTESSDTNSCNVDLSAGVGGDYSAYTHGEVVCSAAHATLPEGMTRGEYVRQFAKAGHGSSSHGQSGSHKP